MENNQSPLILLIDDNSELLLLRQKVLQGQGYKVLSCDNGAQGLSIAAEKLPDLVLLDVVMPGMDGLEVLKALKDNIQTSVIFVVLISGQKTSSDHIARGLEMGADGYLTSPLPNKLLVSQLKTFIRQKHMMDLLRESEQQIMRKNQELKYHTDRIAQINSEYQALNTELSSALRSLTISEKKYKLLAQNSWDVIWTLDLNKGFTYVSPSVEKMRGYSAEEVVKQRFEDSYTRQSLEKMQKALDEMKEWERKGLLKQIFHRLELEQPCKDGSTVITEVITSPIRDHQGKLVEILGISRNITERKKLDAQNRINLDRYKKAQEIGNVGNWEYNLQTNEYWGSDQAKRIYGFDPAIEYFSVEEVESYILRKDWVNQALIDLIEKGKPYDIEFEIIPKNSKQKKVLHSLAELIKDENGRPLLVNGVVQDVTEKRTVERKYHESEDKFKNLAEASPDTIAMYQDDRWIFVNKASEKMTGYTVGELLKMKIWDFTHPDYVDKIKQNGAARQKGKKPVERYEFKIVTKQGQEKWVFLSSASTIYHGKPAGVISVLDISDRKKQEQALAESEEKYRSVVNNSLDGILVIQDEIIVYANPTIEKISGFNHSEISSIDFLDMVYVDDRQMVAQNHRKRLRGENLPSYDFRIMNRENQPQWVHLKAEKIQWNSRGAVLCFISDVHQRKLAEQALQASEEKFKTYIQASPTAVFIVNEKGEYTFANPAAADMLGYTGSELLNLSIPDILPDSYQAKGLNNFEEVVTTGYSKSAELKLIRKDGSIIDILIEAVKLNEHEFMAFCREITDLKNVQRDLQKANEELRTLNEELEFNNSELQNFIIELEKARMQAEESDRLKSSFLANMSHEIRTPMNGILGFAELLKDPEIIDSEQKKYIDIIEKSGERMLNLINDLIDFSKIESGLMTINKSVTNVNDQLAILHAFFKPEADKYHFEFTYKPDSSLQDANLFTDREKLYAVLSNLIKNALKYTNEGSIHFGYQYIRTPDDQSGDARAGSAGQLQFFVKDTGIGIDQKKQATIFERFIQADNRTSRSYEGAGLGLAISKAYIKMLGGRLWVESAPGKGSCFYFTLPVERDDAQNEESPESLISAEPVAEPLNLKILIAEDMTYSSIYLTKVLKKYSREILLAESGTRAVEICRQNSDIDLILMDIKMPGMDGYEATRIIREFNKEVIIIAQTAYAMQGDREKTLQAGCNEYLAKPVKKNLLVKLLNQFFAE